MRLIAIRVLGFLFLLLIAVFGYLYLKDQTPVVPNIVPSKPPPKKPPQPSSLDLTRKQLLAQLNTQTEPQRTLQIPEKKEPALPKPVGQRAIGRQERRHLPLGVVLVNNVAVFETPAAKQKPIFVMQTGDFVRVLETKTQNGRLHIQPGVDIYLAQTSKEFEAAGNRFPDKPGWASSKQIHIFNPDQAIQFTQGVDPMTLGSNPDFSTLSFYERAMKNLDPVVHRVIGPRLISFLGIHEDYNPTWGALYRDFDSKIRSVTLSELKKRGVKNNREIIEDLIRRLAELTNTKATGEIEAEVVTILNILADTQHPRVPAALETFIEGWEKSQSRRVTETAKKILEAK